jgi:hypothetical protein
MTQLRSKLGKTLVDVICSFGLTAVFFAPHPFNCHRFGIIPWLIFGEEGFPPVQFFQGRLAVSVLLWLISIIVVYKRFRYLNSKSYGP